MSQFGNFLPDFSTAYWLCLLGKSRKFEFLFPPTNRCICKTYYVYENTIPSAPMRVTTPRMVLNLAALAKTLEECKF